MMDFNSVHRHLCMTPNGNTVTADHPGPKPDRKDGSYFTWEASPQQNKYSSAEAFTTSDSGEYRYVLS
jgi:hypothetical protein